MPTYRVQRFRSLPEAGGETLFFMICQGRLGTFFKPHEVSEFEGDEAWFEMEKARGRWRFVRQIESPRATTP